MHISKGPWSTKQRYLIQPGRSQKASVSRERDMSYKRLSAAVPSVHVLSAGVLVMVVSASVWAADTRKEFKYNALPVSTVKVSNSVGAIVVHPVAAGRQVIIAATTHSDK